MVSDCAQIQTIDEDIAQTGAGPGKRLKVDQSVAGFTLLEVLVSLTIVALSVTVYFQLMSAGMKLEHASDRRIQQAVQAQQLFEQLQCQDVREDEFQWQGEHKGCTWTLQLQEEEIREQEVSPDEVPLKMNTELYAYLFTYACPEGQTFTFRRLVVLDPGFFPPQFMEDL